MYAGSSPKAFITKVRLKQRPEGDLHVERGDPGSPAAMTGRYHSVRLCIPASPNCRTGAARVSLISQRSTTRPTDFILLTRCSAAFKNLLGHVSLNMKVDSSSPKAFMSKGQLKQTPVATCGSVMR